MKNFNLIMTAIDKLEKIFKDKDLLNQALTHKSWVNEHPNQRGTNERLEFLGDAILEFIISKELYDKFPDKEEGYLTALRANIVNTVNLANVAKRLSIGSSIHLSKGEEETGGRENSSLLADTTEAIIGALFLDQGIEKTKDFIITNLLNDLPDKIKSPLKDAKSRFQEYIQSQNMPTPRYLVVSESGPDHNKNFIVKVVVNEKNWGKGEGKSKSEAEQEAAKKALKKTL